ncbi:MAG: DUF2818 family protein [Gammaproteobacteria bacterium]|nr:DUF2818 family protein [Gammaproteobacteria bacterium]
MEKCISKHGNSFVTTFSLFLVLAVPGVVYRYQWLSMTNKEK